MRIDENIDKNIHQIFIREIQRSIDNYSSKKNFFNFLKFFIKNLYYKKSRSNYIDFKKFVLIGTSKLIINWLYRTPTRVLISLEWETEFFRKLSWQ